VVVREKDVLPGRSGLLRLPFWRARLRRHAERLAPSRRGAAVALGGLVCVPLLLWAARAGPFFTVRAVEVEGAPPALSREIRTALAPVVGRSLVGLDGDEVVARVEALPQVADATYDRSFPHVLVVRIRREVGRAVLRQGRSSWLLSARSRVIRAVPIGSHTGLPRIWVQRSVAVRVGSRLRDAAARRSVNSLGPLRESPLPLAVHAVDARGPLLYKLGRGIELRLGDDTDLALKLAVAAKILQALPAPDAGQHLFLDVTVPDRPVMGSTVNSKVEVEG
jgi:POTRA domain, FtsQ-type